MNAVDRFQAKVEYRDEEDCWEWIGNRSGGKNAGYGQFWVHGRLVKAHRYAYEMEYGPIPDGAVIDHLCRNRGCVNPLHLEAVSHRTNIRRGEGIAAINAIKEACINGHAFDEKNTGYRGATRYCRTCLRDSGRVIRARNALQPPQTEDA